MNAHIDSRPTVHSERSVLSGYQKTAKAGSSREFYLLKEPRVGMAVALPSAEALALALVWACAALASPLSRADALADWNRIAVSTVVQSDQPLEQQLKTMAMVHAAMFEALNFVRGRYRPRFAIASPRLVGMSLDAVAAAAAHHVLVSVYPNKEAALDAALKASLDALPPDPVRGSGVIAGASIAAGVFAVMSSREGAGPAGIAGSRPAPNTRRKEVAHVDTFWGRASPLSWNLIVAELVEAKGLPPDESARIHALVAMVTAEAYSVAHKDAYQCPACVVAESVAYVLRAEFGGGGSKGKETDSHRAMAREISRYALGQYYTPIGAR